METFNTPEVVAAVLLLLNALAAGLLATRGHFELDVRLKIGIRRESAELPLVPKIAG